VLDPRILQLRTEYETEGIDVADLDPDPLRQLQLWLQEAWDAGVPEAHAMVVSTVGAEGMPSSRALLLKGLDEGLVFFTNLESRKARELGANPQAAALFLWVPLHRQVRVEGRVERVSDQVSDAYFASRPPGARLAAVVSPQSEVIPDRAWLERRLEELAQRYPDGEVPRPAYWGGYRLLPDVVEFWQGRLHRLHDRVRYRRRQGVWVRERLAP
jgi:pyridoxamine 5'-phosphate oxidase